MLVEITLGSKKLTALLDGFQKPPLTLTIRDDIYGE